MATTPDYHDQVELLRLIASMERALAARLPLLTATERALLRTALDRSRADLRDRIAGRPPAERRPLTTLPGKKGKPQHAGLFVDALGRGL